MKIVTAEHQTMALERILHQLQLSASRITDSDFKKYGCQGLTHAIQDAKALIEISRQREESEQMFLWEDSSNSSLGLHNL